MRTLIGVLLLVLGLTSGCRVGPHYTPPCVEVPNEWKATEEITADSPCVDYWWEIFGDGTLNTLEVQAIESNPNLYAALERVYEARAMTTVAASGLYPHAVINPSYSNTGELFKIYVPQGLFPAINSSDSIYRIHQFQYALPLTMSYEIDLWGKIRGQYESELFNAQAQAEAYHTAMLTLTTDVANAYYQLKILDAQLTIIEATLKVRNNLLELTKTRFEKGLVNDLDVASAALETANTESLFYDTKRQRALIENIIATLIGIPASDFVLEGGTLTEEPPAIPAGLPAQILLQRPDIAQAERTRASEHALIGVAYASFFPSISLTGILGYSSPDLKEFLKWNSRLWSMGVNGSETVFNGFRDSGNLEAAWARFRQADAAYRQQVLTAFKEVEDSLNNIEYQALQYRSLNNAFQEADRRMILSTTRFDRGLVNVMDVLDNEQIQLNAQISMANALGQRYLSTIQLIKALGGQWQQR